MWPSTATYSYDPTATTQPLQSISQLRLMLADTDLSQLATPPLSVLFADQELTSILNNSYGDFTLAACNALLILANDRSRLATFVQMQGGGSVDLRAVAKELREQVKSIRDLQSNYPAWAYAEMDYGAFSAREIMQNYILRNSD